MQGANNSRNKKCQTGKMDVSLSGTIWQARDWAWLAFTELNLGYAQSRQLVQAWPDIMQLVYEVDLHSLALRAGTLKRWRELRQVDLESHFQEQYRWLQQHAVQLLTWHDARFPEQLKQLQDCPGWLWVEGKVSLLADPAIAMVGGRQASASGLALAHQYAQALAAAGLTVVSGLAVGVDGASHQGALDVAGDTIAILGSGLARVYPTRHQALAAQIVTNGGTLVSPWPLFLSAMPHQFPARNSIVSGLSLGVLVVEAAPKSGSLITAKAALEQGREVFALPFSVLNKKAQGSLDLIRDGACLVYTPEQIIAELAPMLTGSSVKSMTNKAVHDHTGPSDKAHLSVLLQQLLNQLGYDPLPVDIICQQMALPYAAVAAQLMELSLLGYVTEGPQGYVRIK